MNKVTTHQIAGGGNKPSPATVLLIPTGPVPVRRTPRAYDW